MRVNRDRHGILGSGSGREYPTRPDGSRAPPFEEISVATLETFGTARLLAERLDPSHWDDLRRMDSDGAFMALLGGVRDEAGTLAYLERNLAHWTVHGYGLWMLRDRSTGAMAGRAVLRHLDVEGTDEVEIGYGFLPAWWGRGLATEIAGACADLGLGPVGLPSVVAVTLPEHAASQRVMTKAGLRYERDVVHLGLRHVLFRKPAGAIPDGSGSR
jgi:RimJ/RimL family protein N-acetyltransferase